MEINICLFVVPVAKHQRIYEDSKSTKDSFHQFKYFNVT